MRGLNNGFPKILTDRFSYNLINPIWGRIYTFPSQAAPLVAGLELR